MQQDNVLMHDYIATAMTVAASLTSYALVLHNSHAKQYLQTLDRQNSQVVKAIYALPMTTAQQNASAHPGFIPHVHRADSC